MNDMRFHIQRWVKVVGVLMLIIGGLPAIFYFKGQFYLNRKIAELKAQGLPTSFAELEEKSKLPPGTPNAADIYLKAFAAYRELEDPNKQKMLPVLGEQHIPADNEPYPKEQLDAAGEFIELNKEMFDLLHQAGQVKECVYPMAYSAGFPSLGDAFEGVKKANKSLSLAAIYFAETNRPEKALETLKVGLQLAESLSHSNFLTARLLRSGIILKNVLNASRCLNQVNPRDIDMHDLEIIFEKTKIVKFDSAMDGEICAYVEYGKNPSTPVLDNAWITTVSHSMGLFSRNIIKLIEFHQSAIKILQTSTEQRVQYCKEIDKEIDTLGAPYFLTSILAPPLGKIYQIHFRVESNINCALTGLAIEQYRLKENRLPETLDELVPAYLKEVYIDPFNGKPLKYKRTEPGYLVYSVGMDCADNGGKSRDWNISKEQSCDEVFRIYR